METCLCAAAYLQWPPRLWAISLDDDIHKPIKNLYEKVVIALATKDRIKAKSGDWPVNCWFNVFCESVLYTVQKRTVHLSVYLYLHYWIKIPDTFYVPGVNRSSPGSGLRSSIPRGCPLYKIQVTTWQRRFCPQSKCHPGKLACTAPIPAAPAAPKTKTRL